MSFNSINVTNDANIIGRLFANYPDESIPVSAIIGSQNNGPIADQPLNTTSDVSFNSINVTNDLNITGRLYANTIVGTTSIRYSVVQYDTGDEPIELQSVSQYVFISGNNNSSGSVTLPNPNTTNCLGVEVNMRIINATGIDVTVFSDVAPLYASGQTTPTTGGNITLSSLSATFICNGPYWIQFP